MKPETSSERFDYKKAYEDLQKENEKLKEDLSNKDIALDVFIEINNRYMTAFKLACKRLSEKEQKLIEKELLREAGAKDEG